jgi:hypothetical protein
MLAFDGDPVTSPRGRNESERRSDLEFYGVSVDRNSESETLTRQMGIENTVSPNHSEAAVIDAHT